jgi:hypothetical protein
MKKRFLSVLLAVCMVLTLLPATAMAAATKLDTPANLQWITEQTQITVNTAKQERTVYPGDVVWDAVSGGTNKYKITIYDSENQPVYTTTANFGATDKDSKFTVNPFEEGNLTFSSGTYTFGVTALGDSQTTSDSEEARSSAFTYTKPAAKLAAPGTLTWKAATATFSASKDASNARGYDLDFYFSKSDTPASAKIVYSYAWNNTSMLLQPLTSVVIQENGVGYYYFKVRTISSNITAYQNSDWSAISTAYSVQDVNGATVQKVTDAVTSATDAATIADAVETVKSLNSDDSLRAAMAADDGDTGVNQQLKTLEGKAGITTTVVKVDEETAVDTTKVSVVGAALNAKSGSTGVTMNVSKPAQDAVIPAAYRNAVQVDFSLAGVTTTSNGTLAVPVKVTLPLPTGVLPQNFVLLHYHNSTSEYEEILDPYIFLEKGAYYCSFVVTRFSTFVFANAAQKQPALTISDVGPLTYYRDMDFHFSTSGGSGTGAVTYSVPENNGVLNVEGDYATIEGAGTVVVTATKAGDGTYAPATAKRTITVAKDSFTDEELSTKITANADHIPYDGSTHEAVGLDDKNFEGAHTFRYSTTGRYGTYSDVCPKLKNAGSYTVWVEVGGPNTITAYHEVDDTITPATLTVTGVTAASRPYDGTTNVTLAGGALTGVVSGDRVDFTLGSGTAASKDVGTRAVTTAIVLTGKDAANYTLTQPAGVTVNITQAAAKTIADQNVTQKYTVTTQQSKSLAGLMPADAGTLAYAAGTSGTTGSVSVSSWNVASDGTVTYTLSGGAAGDTVTLPVTISSTNYEPSAVKVKITLTVKDVPELTIRDITRTYDGTAVADSAISGTAAFGGKTVEGTWAFKVGQALTSAADSGSKTVVFTPKDGNTYAAVEKNITVTIAKAVPTGTPSYTAITEKDKTLADAKLAAGTLAPAGGKIAWDKGDTTAVTANTAYAWTYTPADTANYTTLTGSITPYLVSAPGRSASGGTAAAAQPSGSSPFTDVPESSYCYPAVVWAANSGVAEGKSAGLFAPSDTCTRAQAVTFLWRAMGSPEPAGTRNPFTDVSADAYYCKAVLWAAEKGITRGTTDTTFDPDGVVTRAQTVTFLWRAAGSPAAAAANPFGDVAPGAYCAGAVAWAVGSGITEGTSAAAFSPAASCTRAQIVTFLWRFAGK